MLSKRKPGKVEGGVMRMRWKFVKSFPILLTVFFVGQVLLRKVEGESTTTTTTVDDEDEEMKCVCDGGCEHLRESDCPWGLTLDVCGCCFLCARGENEPCAGAFGTCAIGLRCQSKYPPPKGKRIVEGTCTRDKGICDRLEKHHGCTFQGGNCECEERVGCPGEELFLFDTEESCRSHTAFLIAKRDFEPFTSHVSQTDDCHEVQCPKVKECPPDSYRLPAIIDSSHETCCPPVQSCHCNPGLLCPSPPKCSDGSLGNLLTNLNLTGQPGHCCPTYECAEKNEGSEKVREDEVLKSVCSFSGKMYESGESWVHEAECSECNCYHGVVSCKPIQCDLHESCTLVRAEPGSCCPVCVGCVGSSGALHNNSDVWDEDPCTTCECTEGRIKCHAAMCQTTCLNPTHIPGECCPRCNNGLECPIMDCHRECPNGFRLTKAGCPTCKCNKCRSLADCVKECQFGFETNEKGCPICHCRQSEVEEDGDGDGEEGAHAHGPHDTQVHQPALRVVSKSVADLGLKCDGTWDGTQRLNGEEWSDSCRRCVCKNGSEMCSLITCPLPQCEHPIFYPKSCCPRCPGEHVDLFEPENGLSVCQSLDGVAHVDGDTWKIGGCLTCTCHDGQVLCAGPDCPPTPCPHSRIQNEGDCCLTCPNNMSGTINDKNISSAQSKSSSSSYCFSDDSQKVYAEGEMWKVGPCQSCICQGGQVHCFSGGKCLTLECERPILAKNQCCPICLESETRKIVTSSIDLRDEGGDNSPGSQSQYVPFNRSATTEFGVKSNPKSTLPISSSSDVTTATSDDKGGLSSSGGLEPHCAIIITALVGVSCLLILYIVRSCFFRRRVSLTKKLPFHSSNSSSGTSPPVTPDCCYKYTSCAQNSEQKTPLCHNNSTSRNTNSILTSGDKV